MNGFYAIQHNANNTRHFFEWNKEDTFATREQLEQAIEQWKKRVTPRMAESTQFEIRQD